MAMRRALLKLINRRLSAAFNQWDAWAAELRHQQFVVAATFHV
jgi:hypothetical protein